MNFLISLEHFSLLTTVLYYLAEHKNVVCDFEQTAVRVVLHLITFDLILN